MPHSLKTSQANPVRGFFITGTDTGVGKTIVSAALAAAFRGRGLDVGVMKPFESGCTRDHNGNLIPEDAIMLKAAAASKDPLKLINPYSFEQPLAPALAAEISGIDVKISPVIESFNFISQNHNLVLVEGAGGLLAPLVGQVRNLDLALTLDLPILIVAKNVLGAINQADLTSRMARASNASVIGIILNRTSYDADPAITTNAAALQKWVASRYLGEMPYLVDIDYNNLRHAAENNLKLDILLESISEV